MLPKLDKKQADNTKSISRLKTKQSVKYGGSTLDLSRKISDQNSVSMHEGVNQDKNTALQAKIQGYQKKFMEESELNAKLKQLYMNIKDSTHVSNEINQEEQSLLQLKKSLKKEQNRLQGSKHSLNILFSENQKLKKQVSCERNKRAVYFNIYKNLQHEIHAEQTKYKHLLIDGLIAEGTINKIKQKFNKANKKVSKNIEEIKNQIADVIKQQDRVINGQIIRINKQQQQEKEQQSEFQREQKHLKQKTNRNNKIKSAQENQPVNNELQVNDVQTQSVESKKYRIQQKNLTLTGIISRLANICGISHASTTNNHISDSVRETVDILKNLPQTIENLYEKYLSQELKQKQLDNQIFELKQEIKRIELSKESDSQITSPQLENSSEYKDYVKNTSKIDNMEQLLSEKIGIKVKNLTNQMVLHYCLRIKEEKQVQQTLIMKKIPSINYKSEEMQKKDEDKTARKPQPKVQKDGKKNIEKYLEISEKNKLDNSTIMSPRQMHQSILEFKKP